MYGLFFPASQKAAVYVVDTVRTNQMPNMTNLFNAEHVAKLVMSYFRLFYCRACCRSSSSLSVMCYGITKYLYSCSGFDYFKSGPGRTYELKSAGAGARYAENLFSDHRTP